MTNLTIIYELFTNGYLFTDIFFLSIFSIIIGVSTIVAYNPIYSVLFLIGLYIGVSLYLSLIGLQFIAVAYILVYVGAISILFIFILMLINIRVSELLTEGSNSIPLAIIIILCFNFVINPILPYNVFGDIYSHLLSLGKLVSNSFVDLLFNNNKLITTRNDNFMLTSVSSKSWEESLTEISHISGIGNVLYSGLLISLIIISLIILLSMVGAIVLTVTNKGYKGSVENMKPVILKTSIFTLINPLVLTTVNNTIYSVYCMWRYQFKTTFFSFIVRRFIILSIFFLLLCFLEVNRVKIVLWGLLLTYVVIKLISIFIKFDGDKLIIGITRFVVALLLGISIIMLFNYIICNLLGLCLLGFLSLDLDGLDRNLLMNNESGSSNQTSGNNPSQNNNNPQGGNPNPGGGGPEGPQHNITGSQNNNTDNHHSTRNSITNEEYLVSDELRFKQEVLRIAHLPAYLTNAQQDWAFMFAHAETCGMTKEQFENCRHNPMIDIKSAADRSNITPEAKHQINFYIKTYLEQFRHEIDRRPCTNNLPNCIERLVNIPEKSAAQIQAEGRLPLPFITDANPVRPSTSDTLESSIKVLAFELPARRN